MKNDELIHYLPLEEWPPGADLVVVRCGKVIWFGPGAELVPPTDFTHVREDVTCRICRWIEDRRKRLEPKRKTIRSDS